MRSRTRDAVRAIVDVHVVGRFIDAAGGAASLQQSDEQVEVLPGRHGGVESAQLEQPCRARVDLIAHVIAAKELLPGDPIGPAAGVLVPAADRHLLRIQARHRLAGVAEALPRLDEQSEPILAKVVVVVEAGGEFAARHRQGAVARRRRALRRFVARDAQPRIGRGEALQALPGRIARAVVDDDQLQLAVALPEHRGDGPCHRFDAVVRRHVHADEGCHGVPLSRARCARRSVRWPASGAASPAAIARLRPPPRSCAAGTRSASAAA